ncbi:MAG: aldehyde dehydrogenase family protein [Fimbriimonadaceae bacterium]|nr:aldehyde dehydrogenase family protein [Fimbriimonadaceae bacterium]
MIHRELLIGGVFLGGECDQGIGKEVSRNPYNMTLVGTSAEAGAPEVEAAIVAATDAFSTWRKSTGAERAPILRRIAELIRERTPELELLAADEIGKPVALARGELIRTALTFELAAEIAEQASTKEVDLAYDPRSRAPLSCALPMPGSEAVAAEERGRGRGDEEAIPAYTAQIARFPIGPILCITPYNWPFNLAAHKVAPALAAGNTVILKGSSAAPLCSLSLARIIHEAGCPPGVLNAIQTVPPLAEKMATDPRIAMVSFTGSPAVGWHLKKLCSDKRVALELGGDAYAVVCEDAELDRAAKRCAAGGFAYAGQICISVQHVVAHESVYDDLRERLIQETEETKFGNPREEHCVCGPLITPEAALKVMEWIEESEQRGSEVLVGGNRIGNIVEPTLIEMPERWDGEPPRISCEEVFGPIITLSRYSDFGEVIERINRGRYGIHTGVFTTDQQRIQQAFNELEVGGVVIGDGPNIRFDALPYGGVKQSGFGREGVRFAYEEMTEWKSLVTASDQVRKA